MPKSLAFVLLNAAAVASLGFAASAQTQSPPTPPAATTPPIVPATPMPAKPPKPPAPVDEPESVPPEQGDTVTGPSRMAPATPATPAAPGESAAVPATPASPAMKSTLTAGATVKDSQGNTIGTVSSVGPGNSNVVLTIDGKSVSVAQSVLVQTGDTIVSSQTKAQLLADAKPKPK